MRITELELYSAGYEQAVDDLLTHGLETKFELPKSQFKIMVRVAAEAQFKAFKQRFTADV